MAALYRIRAAHVAEKLKLKELREKVTDPVEAFTNYEMAVKLGENSYIFIYNYGSIVFFNVAENIQERYLTLIRDTKEGARIGDTNEVFLVEAHPEGLDANSNQVYFDRVIVAQMNPAKIKIICMLVAESTALDYYDILIENLLENATIYTKKLEAQGKLVESNEDLLKFVGMCLSAKQEIISNLYIVDSPDETWENSELDKIFHDLKQMFEIDVRYRAVEYKSKIIQESVEVITDLLRNKHGVRLEVAVIVLIAFEILMSLIKFH